MPLQAVFTNLSLYGPQYTEFKKQHKPKIFTRKGTGKILP